VSQSPGMSAGLGHGAEHVAAAAPGHTPHADARSPGARERRAGSCQPRHAHHTRGDQAGLQQLGHAQGCVRAPGFAGPGCCRRRPRWPRPPVCQLRARAPGWRTSAAAPPPAGPRRSSLPAPRHLARLQHAYDACHMPQTCRAMRPAIAPRAVLHHLISINAGLDMHRQIQGASETWHGCAPAGVARRDVGAWQRGGVLPAGPQVGLAQHRVRDQVRLHQLGPPAQVSARAARAHASGHMNPNLILPWQASPRSGAPPPAGPPSPGQRARATRTRATGHRDPLPTLGRALAERAKQRSIARHS